MTGIRLFGSSILLFAAMGSGALLRAADEPAPPPGRPTREEIRQSFRNLPPLTPEERVARLKAIRDRGGIGAPAADALLKLREDTKDLPPAQRRARIREWRETNAFARPALGAMSAEEREARRKVFQIRIEQQIATLKKKQADNSFTEEDGRRLQNMERMLKWLESSRARVESAPGNPPLGLPPPAVPAPQPSKPGDPAKSK